MPVVLCLSLYTVCGLFLVLLCVGSPRENGWKKRGLALVPTKFGIAFGVQTMCQGGALLLVYTDGSVLLSHGGMEMGQGLHTKMVQVCSCVLGISHHKIHIQESNSSVVPNASPTAASYSTDLYGMAVKVILNLCNRLKNKFDIC